LNDLLDENLIEMLGNDIEYFAELEEENILDGNEHEVIELFDL